MLLLLLVSIPNLVIVLFSPHVHAVLCVSWNLYLSSVLFVFVVPPPFYLFYFFLHEHTLTGCLKLCTCAARSMNISAGELSALLEERVTDYGKDR